MREQEEELLDQLARLEDDESTSAPPFFAKPVNGRGEIPIRVDVGEEPKWIRAREHDLHRLDRLDLIRTDKDLGQTRCALQLTQKGRDDYRERNTHTMTILEPLLPEPRENVLDWNSEVLPVLRAAYEAYGRQPLTLGIARAYVDTLLGRPEDDPQTILVLAALAEDGYITSTMDSSDDPAPYFFKLTERARQVVAGWPGGTSDDILRAFLLTLDRRIESASSEEERGRLHKVRDAVAGLGTDLAAKVLSNVITGA